MKTLDQAPLEAVYRIRRVHAQDVHNELVHQLEEIGFLPGEPVAILARGFPGGDPLVVRVGLSTYALRNAEARCIEIEEVHDA